MAQEDWSSIGTPVGDGADDWASIGTPVKPGKQRGDYMRGLASYGPQLQSVYGAGKAIVGKAVGSDSLIQSGIESMREADTKQQAIGSKPYDEFTGIRSIGDAVDWAQHGLGQVTGNLLETGATALGGSLIGGAVGGPAGGIGGAATGVIGKTMVKGALREAGEKIAKEQGLAAAQKFVQKKTGQAIGANAAIGAGAAFHGVGETGGRAIEEAGYDMDKVDLGKVGPAAAIHTGLEFAGDKVLLGGLANKGAYRAAGEGMKPLAKTIAGNAAIVAGKEIPVELGQTAAERYAGNLPLADESAGKEYLNTAAQTALFGIAGVPAGVRAHMATPSETNQQRILREVSERGKADPIDRAALDQWASGYGQPAAPVTPSAPAAAPAADMLESAAPPAAPMPHAGPLSAAVQLGTQTGAVQPQGIASVQPAAPAIDTAAAAPATPLQSVTAPTASPSVAQATPDTAQSAQPAFDRAAIFADIAARTASGEISKPHKAAGDILANAAKQGIIPPEQVKFTAAENEMLASAKRSKPALPDAKPLAERSDDELRAQLSNAQAPSVRATIAKELQRRKDAAGVAKEIESIGQRTDQQLAYLAEHGKPGMKEAAIAEAERRAKAPKAAPQKIADVQPAAAPQTATPPAASKRAPTFVGGEQPKAGGILAQMPAAMPLPKSGKAAPATVAPAQETRDDLIARYKKTKPFSDEESTLSDRLKQSTRQEIDTKLNAGEAPVFDTGRDTFVTVTPSAQQPGKFQVTRYNKGGVFGDTQYDTIEQAVSDNRLHGSRILPKDEAEARFAESLKAEAEYQARKGRPADDQPPETVSKKETVAPTKQVTAKPQDEVAAISSQIHQSIARHAIASVKKMVAEKVGKGYMTPAQAEARIAEATADWEKSKTNERTDSLAKAIAEKDPRPLVDAWAKEGRSIYGSEGSVAAFEKLAGVKIARLKSEERAKAIFKWAGWTDQQAAEHMAERSKAKAQRDADYEAQRQKENDERIERRAETEQVQFRDTGNKKSIKEHVDSLIAQGFDTIRQGPRGAVKKTYLVNEKGEGYHLPAGIMRDYAALAVRRNAEKKAAVPAQQPPAAPAQSTNAAADTQAVKGEGKEAVGGAQPGISHEAEAAPAQSAPEQKPADNQPAPAAGQAAPAADQAKSKPLTQPEQRKTLDDSLLAGAITVDDYMQATGLTDDDVGVLSANNLREQADRIAKERSPYHQAINKIHAALSEQMSEAMNASINGTQQRKTKEERIARINRDRETLDMLARKYEHPFNNDYVSKLPIGLRRRFAAQFDEIATGRQARDAFAKDSYLAWAELLIEAANQKAETQPAKQPDAAPQLYRPVIADFFASLPSNYATADEVAEALAKTDFSADDKAAIQRVEAGWVDMLDNLETAKKVTIKC